MNTVKKGLLMVVYCVLFLGLSAPAYSAKLPKVVACTSYGVGAAGYTVASGLGEAVNKLTPMKWRVEPYGTGIERIAPLKFKQTEFTLITNVTSMLAYKGYDEFAMWGPQPLRLIAMGNTIRPGMYVRQDSGIKTIADLRGKRVPDIKGNPTVMREIEAILAFGNLTYADVKKIPVSGFGAAMQAVLDGDVDASMASIFSSKVKELCSGPHGCQFLEMPAANKAGWKRAQKILPAIFPSTQAKVAGLDKPVELFGISYALYAYPWLDDAVAYNVVKALDKGYGYFKKSHPWLKQWKLNNMVKNAAIIPFHPGAVKYYRDAGVWNDSLERYQSSVLK